MKAVVCGAGIAGLTIAGRLAVHGWDVTVVESARALRSSGYMIDFFGLGYDAAEVMGVLPRVLDLGYTVDEWMYVDRTGARRSGLSFKGFAQAVGGRVVSIMRPSLELALREMLCDSVDLRLGCSVEKVVHLDEGVRVSLTDGSVLDADLLVGADGIHSEVRRLVFGEEDQFFRFLGFHTAAYVFDDPAIAAEVGERFCLTDTVDHQMGLYVLHDRRIAAFTVHRTEDAARPADPAATLRHVYRDLGWVVPGALSSVPEPPELYYDQVAQVDVPVWTRGRVVLVGDACQAVSLLAGQGASLAVAGAYVLGELLAECTPVPGSVEQALRGYEATWRPVVVEKQAVGRRGAQWFLPSSELQLWVRRLVMRAARSSALTPLVARAMTGTDDVTLGRLVDRGRATT
jgi:2-polyprenyl-6-methoxyphenol hydroxylase-like FAD-dependent oxidoreductase